MVCVSLVCEARTTTNQRVSPEGLEPSDSLRSTGPQPVVYSKFHHGDIRLRVPTEGFEPSLHTVSETAASAKLGYVGVIQCGAQESNLPCPARHAGALPEHEHRRLRAARAASGERSPRAREYGLGGRIRTCGLRVPNAALGQAKLRPDAFRSFVGHLRIERSAGSVSESPG